MHSAQARFTLPCGHRLCPMIRARPLVTLPAHRALCAPRNERRFVCHRPKAKKNRIFPTQFSTRYGSPSAAQQVNNAQGKRLSCFFAPILPTPKTFFFEGVVPRDDMHEAFRMTSGAQKRRPGRYTHVIGSPSVRFANRCVCAPDRRTTGWC